MNKWKILDNGWTINTCNLLIFETYCITESIAASEQLGSKSASAGSLVRYEDHVKLVTFGVFYEVSTSFDKQTQEQSGINLKDFCNFGERVEGGG